jgi:hypothetical protein
MAKKRKPTTGESKKKRGPFYVANGDVNSRTHGIMWAKGVDYPAETMLGRFMEAYEIGRKSRDRAIAAAVRKERERCEGVMNRPQLTMQQRTWAIKEGR